MNPKQLSNIINDIYSATLSNYAWPHVSLQVQKAIGGHSVNFVIEDKKLKQFKYIFSNGATDSDVAYYHRNIIQRDEITDILDNNPIGNALITQDFWQLKQLERIWAYDNFYKNIGLTYFTTGKFFETKNTRAFITVARSQFDTPYNSQDRQDLQLLLPHLERALFLNKTLLQQQAITGALGDSFERLSIGIILLNANGKVIYTNKIAQPFLSLTKCCNSRYSIRLPNGASSLKLSQNIDKALTDSAYQPGTCLRFMYRGVHHVAYCFPWCDNFNHQEWFGDNSRCIIFIVSSESFSITGQYLFDLFHLSNAEANVAEGLIRGLTVKELAETLFVSDATVRFHIRNILKKTETTSQIAAVGKMIKYLLVPMR